MKNYNIAIVGATGLVGRKLIELLFEYNIPINNLYLYASSKSANKTIEIDNKQYIIMELNEENIKEDIDFVIASAGSDVSQKYASKFLEKGTYYIDNSSAFRMNEAVPLIVPSVNFDKIKNAKLISNPNCSTIQSVIPLKILDDLYSIKRIVYNTYQAVSGSGQKGILDYERTRSGLEPAFYPYSINDNCIPHIDNFLDNGYTKEEMKMINETKKILDKDILITATCVRVPIKNSHAVSINVELEKEFDIEEIKRKFEKSSDIVLYDDPINNIYPLEQITNDQDKVYVGRIRKDESLKNTLNLWCVADNIRIGAASNAIQILKCIIAGESEGFK